MLQQNVNLKTLGIIYIGIIIIIIITTTTTTTAASNSHGDIRGRSSKKSNCSKTNPISLDSPSPTATSQEFPVLIHHGRVNFAK